MTKKTGVLFVGALGSVATTTIAGVFAVNRELAPLRGMISSESEFETLDLVSLENLVFGGWDLRNTNMPEMVKDHDIVPERIVEGVESDLNDVTVWKACLMNKDDHLRNVYKIENEARTLSEACSTIKQQIQAFKEEHDLEHVVVVNTASTETKVEPETEYESLAAFKKGIEDNSAAIRFGMLYAYAALDSECAYVNFTPSVTVEIPALKELASIRNVPIAGKDGRTGQTLYKHVLGRMFQLRGLKVKGWYSTNILGNDDGAVLEDPNHSETKIGSKTVGLERILGYDDFDHRVRIDYFPMKKDKKEAWDAIEFEGWLGERLAMKINWLGADSILAAPLIVDLVRFMDHALREGFTGTMDHLALFFKSPYDTDEYALDQQYSSLLNYVRRIHGD